MKILITGGAGYIGSFMVKRLLNEGYQVTVADSLERGHKDAIDNRAKLLVGDLLDGDFIKKVFSDEQYETVVHLAGYISMEESMKNPELYFTNNTVGALRILEEMVKNSVDTFIFSSTAGVYGNPQTPILAETHPKNPTNPYGESKLMVEQMLQWFEKIHNIRFASLRYFNASGAMLDGSMGERHNPETHVIPLALHAAYNNSELTLYGSDYDTPDRTCIRDYIHVVDLVEAHVLAIKKLQEIEGGFFYNVGTGKGFSNKEVVDMVKKITGSDFKVVIADRRSGDASILVSDPTKVKKELGFSPKYSDLETIIKTAWEWYRKNQK